MTPKQKFYLALAALWLVLAIAIWFGFHEEFLGQLAPADEWKRYLSISIALLMMVWNLLRVYWLQQRKTAPRQDHVQPF